MRVTDLADELGIPTSAVLAQCQRFGLDASWAGAELGGADVVILRAELAADDETLDLTGHGETPRAGAGGGAGPGGQVGPSAGPALPPTAVGSLPDLLDELTPAAEPGEPAEPVRRPGFGAAPPRPDLGPTPEVRRVVPPVVRTDRGVRRATVALAVAVLALVLAEIPVNAWLVAACWAVALVAVIVGLVQANRARYHATTHPERIRGLAPAVALLVVGSVLLTGLAAGGYLILRAAPAVDAPVMGELRSVQRLRWGANRLGVLASSGWSSRARPVGSCWAGGGPGERREEERLEDAPDGVDCGRSHQVEVAAVFALDRDADSAYPGTSALTALARSRCPSLVDEVATGWAEDDTVEVVTDFATAAGWREGDHDVACVLVTPPRTGSLLDP